MKWPRVLPCNPVPSWPSNSACLRGKNGLQCGFNPTQPLLGFNGFLTSQLPSHLTHLHVTSSFSCSRCNFISRRATLQCLFCRSLCLLSFKQVFPLFFSSFHSFLLFSKKKRCSKALAIFPRLMMWFEPNTRRKPPVMTCLDVSYLLSPRTQFHLCIVCSWSAGGLLHSSRKPT